MLKRNRSSEPDHSKRIKVPEILDLYNESLTLYNEFLIQKQRAIEFQQKISDPAGLIEIKIYFTSMGYSDPDMKYCLGCADGIIALEALYSAHPRLEILGFSLKELKILILFPNIAHKIDALLTHANVLLALRIPKESILKVLVLENGGIILSEISKYALQLNALQLNNKGTSILGMIKSVNQRIDDYLNPPIVLPPQKNDVPQEKVSKIIEDLLAQNFKKEDLLSLAHRKRSSMLFTNLHELYNKLKGKITQEELITIAKKDDGCFALSCVNKYYLDLDKVGFTLAQIISLVSGEKKANVLKVLWDFRSIIKDPKQPNDDKNGHELSIEESIYLAENIKGFKTLKQILGHRKTFFDSGFSSVDMLMIGNGESGCINLNTLVVLKDDLLKLKFTTEHLVKLACLKKGNAVLRACDHLIKLGFQPDDIVGLAYTSNKDNDKIRDVQKYTQQLLDAGYTIKRILDLLNRDKVKLKDEVGAMRPKVSSNKASFFAHSVVEEHHTITAFNPEAADPKVPDEMQHAAEALLLLNPPEQQAWSQP